MFVILSESEGSFDGERACPTERFFGATSE